MFNRRKLRKPRINPTNGQYSTDEILRQQAYLYPCCRCVRVSPSVARLPLHRCPVACYPYDLRDISIRLHTSSRYLDRPDEPRLATERSSRLGQSSLSSPASSSTGILPNHLMDRHFLRTVTSTIACIPFSCSSRTCSGKAITDIAGGSVERGAWSAERG